MKTIMTPRINILFLNGVSSAGKTSIAKRLQLILNDAYLHVGVDHFMEMMPAKYLGQDKGINFNTSQINGKPSVKINVGKIGKRVMQGMRHAIASLAHQGNPLIIDEVLINNEMEDYTALLKPFNVFYIGVFAPLAVLEAREKRRQNRLLGLARGQYDSVHTNNIYDLIINTASLSPMRCAKLIKEYFDL